MPRRQIEGYQLDYAEAGDGPPLVLIHGTLLDQRYWEPQLAAFSQHFRVYALSLRYYWPNASDGGGTDFTIARHTADIAAFLRSLGSRAHLLGHSRGGHLAFRVASQHPELIDRLVLAEPGGELDESLGGVPPAGEQAAGFARAAAEVEAGRIEDGLRIFAEQAYGKDGWDRWSASRKQVAFDNAITLIGQRHENRQPYSREAAERITAPTLLINGDQTRPNFIRNCEILAGVIAHAQRVVIPRAGHPMSADNPEDFNQTVLNFLNGSGSGA